MVAFAAKLKVLTTAFIHGEWAWNMAEYKQCSYSLRKLIKQVKCQYRDKVELQFNGSDTRRMWQGPQGITDYKMKTSHVTLPDKLNTFFDCFEDNTVPLLWPANKDWAPLSSSVADLSKILKRVNPRKGCWPRLHP